MPVMQHMEKANIWPKNLVSDQLYLLLSKGLNISDHSFIGFKMREFNVFLYNHCSWLHSNVKTLLGRVIPHTLAPHIRRVCGPDYIH